MIRHPAPIVIQQADHDCGPACVESLLSWAGYTTDTAALLRATRATVKHGTDPEDLAAILEAAKLRPVIDEEMTRDELTERLEVGPVIGMMRAYATGHFVVMRRDDCRLGDDGEMICPKCGRQMRRYHAAYEGLNR